MKAIAGILIVFAVTFIGWQLVAAVGGREDGQPLSADSEERDDRDWPIYPGTTSIGWESVHTVGGGSVFISGEATADAPRAVVDWFRAQLGHPSEHADESTTWHRESVSEGRRSASSLTVGDIDWFHRAGRLIEHEDLPPGTRTVIVHMSASFPVEADDL